MKYTKEDIEKLFYEICDMIENGKSLRQAANQKKVNFKTFYEWIDNDKEIKSKHYARACEVRSEKLADEILKIADDSSQDTITITTSSGNEIEAENKEWVNRSKLRVDARKWLLSKLLPKKYGDKLDVTTDGDKLDSGILMVEIVRKEKS